MGHLTTEGRRRIQIAGLLLPLIGACAAPISNPKMVSPGGNTPTNQQSAEQKPAEPERDTALSAVESFLDRTKDYQSKPTAVTPAIETKQVVTQSNTDRAQPSPANRPITKESANTTAVPAVPTSTVVANGQVAIDSAAPRPRQSVPVLEKVSIRPPAVPANAETLPAAVSMSNQPLEAVPMSESDVADRFMADLARQAKTSGRLTDAWRLRLVGSLLDRPTRIGDTAETGTLSTEAKQLAADWIDVSRALADSLENPLHSADEAIERVEKVRDSLVSRADPVVNAVALCRKVLTFGVFEPMLPEEMVAGRSMQTIVYCELKNLRSEPVDGGQYRTALSTRIELFSADGKSLWHQEEPKIEDLCRRKRSDFFIAQRIALPANLTPGDYVLKVTVTDELSNRMNEGGLPFTLKSAGSVAQGG